MRNLLPLLSRSCGLAAFALACFAACSGGGGGGGGQAQPQPLPQGNFAGTWDFELVVTASTDPNIPVGGRELATLVITVVGTTATLASDTGNFVGIVNGPNVQLQRADGTLSLTIDANDRITGTANVAEAGQTATFAVTAVRNQGGGNALALATGTWSFVVDIEGSPLFFSGGALTQNGAAVVFEFVDASATPPITSTWTGDLTGAQWTPVVTGTLPFAVEGTFAADGQSFNGTFTSLVIGNGTITGNLVP